MKINFAYRDKDYDNDGEHHKLFIHYRDSFDSFTLVINLRLIIPILLILFLITYITGTIVIYFKSYQKNNTSITYFDVINPLKWRDLEKKKALDQIQYGLDLISIGNSTEGVNNIRDGLLIAPNNAQVRLYLSKYYVGNDDIKLAIELLKDGFNYNINDIEYYDKFFKLAVLCECYDSILEVTAKAIKNNKLSSKIEFQNSVFFNHAKALYKKNKFKSLLIFLDEFEFKSDFEIELIHYRVNAFIKLNRFDSAIEYVLKFKNKYINSPKYLELIADTYRLSGRDLAFKTALNELVKLNPERINTYLYQIKSLHNNGEVEKLNDLFESTLTIFKSNNKDLLKITKLAAQLPSSKLTKLCLDSVDYRSSVYLPVYFSYITAIMLESKWDLGLKEFTKFKNSINRSTNYLDTLYYYKLFNILFYLDEYGISSAELKLNEFTNDNNLPIDFYLESCEILRLNNKIDVALYLINGALKKYDESPRIKNEHNLVKNLLNNRNKTANYDELIAVSYLAIDHIDKLIEKKDYVSAIDFLKTLESKNPSWVEENKNIIAKKHLIIDLDSSDLAYAKIAIRNYLAVNRMRGIELISLAQEYKAKGRGDIARIIVEEIAIQTPNAKGIRGLLNNIY